MINLLLLSAGTNACYHIAKILKHKFANDFHIIGADINEAHLIPTILFLDSFHKVPYANDSSYYSVILDICKQERVDYILPSFDVDQKLFYPENPDLLKLGVTSLSTPKETLAIYDNKVKMNDFLTANQFSVPQRYLPDECKDNDVYMVKPVNGVGSVGAGLKTGIEIKRTDLSDYIIQERCFEPEMTLECFWYNGQISTICRERIATKAGVCTKTHITNNQELAAIAQRFALRLKTPIIFNLQFMKNTQNQFVITDVNLRTAGGMSLSYAAGWDEVSALAKIMLHKTDVDIFATLANHVPNQFVVRAYEEIVTKKADAVVAFDWDGTLLDSRQRHKLVMDEVLKDFGIALDTSDLIEFKRNGKNNISYLIAKGIEEQLATKIQQEWINHIEDETYLATDKLYNDALDNLKKYENYDLILVTARNNELNLRKQVDRLGLTKFFKTIFVVSPNSEVIAQKAKILAEQNAVIMVGDTKSDYEAAQLAGVDFEFHANGFHCREIIE